jgi:hypothetical protein
LATEQLENYYVSNMGPKVYAQLATGFAAGELPFFVYSKTLLIFRDGRFPTPQVDDLCSIASS